MPWNLSPACVESGPGLGWNPQRLGYLPRGTLALDTSLFRHPDAPPPQGDLFGE
jgi:hypothetical protein